MSKFYINHDHKEELKELALKATPARKAVLDLLESSSKPLDIISVFEYLKKRKISSDIATVFRIINAFTDKGLTKKIEFREGKFRYELSAKEDHHHLVCNKCGNVEDVSDCNIKSLEKDIEKKKKFKVLNHSLEFFGLCSNCQN